MKHGKNHAFVNACWGNGHHISPMRDISYGCFLLLFSSQQFRDIRKEYSEVTFCLRAKDLHCNQCYSLEVSLGR